MHFLKQWLSYATLFDYTKITCIFTEFSSEPQACFYFPVLQIDFKTPVIPVCNWLNNFLFYYYFFYFFMYGIVISWKHGKCFLELPEKHTSKSHIILFLLLSVILYVWKQRHCLRWIGTLTDSNLLLIFGMKLEWAWDGTEQ